MRIAEIYDALLAEATTMPSLSGLMPSGVSADYASQSFVSRVASRSRVAVWQLMLWVVAAYCYTVEQLLADHKMEVTRMAEAAIPGNDAWLCQQAKQFELGNTSIAVSPDRKVVYATSLGPDSRIVTHAAVARVRGRAVLKLAKGGATPVALTGPELTSFASYLNQIRFAGTQVAIISLDPDQVKAAGTFYYDGMRNLDELKSEVAAAGATYLNSLPFDGFISVEGLTDAIQQVPGMQDLTPVFFARPASGPYPSTAIVGRGYASLAGYAVFDSSSLYTSETIWIPL